MPTRLFRIHGDFCASNPWEVIVTTITLTTCILFIDHRKSPIPTPIESNKYAAVDLVFMTLIRCLAVLYSYYHFRKLQKLGCRFVLGISGLFTVFSSFVFTSAVIKVLGVDLNELKDALFFFLLLIDLNKATALAEFALTATDKQQVKTNIANGISILGPSITLDTLVEILVIGIGSLTGVRRLETLSYFACLSVIVNYVVFMTFYPSLLSLTLELTNLTPKRPLITATFKEEDKSNPVVQRVKLIMAFGLLWVHLRSRWSMRDGAVVVEEVSERGTADGERFSERFLQWVTCSVDHIVILILLGALVVKFVFFEEKEIVGGAGEGKEESVGGLLRCLKAEKHTQTEKDSSTESTRRLQLPQKQRLYEECLQIYKQNGDLNNLSDAEVLILVAKKSLPTYQLEKLVDNPERGVRLRRLALLTIDSAHDIPFEGYDYTKVIGACCENVIGYMPLPVGVAGPLNLDGELLYIPMATTEGCLVASTNRGCRALLQNGVQSRLTADGMTRGPVVRFPSATRAADASLLLKSTTTFSTIKSAFDSTSRYARLTALQVRVAGRHLFLRFVATTGDAMGMNMVSKGAETALEALKSELLPDMEVMSLSGNYCADKKASAVNWVDGRGKSVVCEAVVTRECVRKVLKTTVERLIELNVSKNLVGSAVAGSVGGFNAHAANVVTAVFIATGQDPAQNVTSSNCITLLEPHGDDLHVSCTMPSIEVGTVGGGTQLPPQAACLSLLGCRGGDPLSPGAKASRLARIVCAAVLAGELSLLAALCSGQLVESHMRMNRSVSEGGR